MLGSTVVTRVLHKACVGWEESPGVVCVAAGYNDGVNLEDEGLGQPRQVMAAGMHGPSRQLIFDIGCA